jgi:hypothetical protein
VATHVPPFLLPIEDLLGRFRDTFYAGMQRLCRSGPLQSSGQSEVYTKVGTFWQLIEEPQAKQ